MEPTQKPRRRLNIVAKTARTQRIFERLRDGWAYDDIAKEEHLTAERIRQIVAKVLEHRVVDTSEDHAHLQLERLRPALLLVGEAVKRGDIRAIGPLIKLIDRLDKHRGAIKKTIYYGDEHRKKLLDKINWIASNLAEDEKDPALKAEAGESEDAPAAATSGEGAGPEDFFARVWP